MIDFTNCQIIPGRAYNGANGSKIAVSYAGEIYMLKFPPSGDGKPTELSYTNSCISEHIASSIFNMLGIPAQETILGSYTVKGKTKTVCACKDFSTGGKRLFDFCSIKNTILDSDSNGSGTELDDIMDTIDRQQYVSPMILRSHFWDMFVADALLGNFDRHNGNWDFCMMITPEKRKSPRYLTAEAVFCPRRTKRLCGRCFPRNRSFMPEFISSQLLQSSGIAGKSTTTIF